MKKKQLTLALLISLATILASPAFVHAQTYQHVTTITGSSDQTTNYFTVTSNEWRIAWSYTPDPEYPQYSELFIAVYPQGETTAYIDSFTVTGNTTTSGTENIHQGNGNYYLRILDANIPSYTLNIESQTSATPTPAPTLTPTSVPTATPISTPSYSSVPTSYPNPSASPSSTPPFQSFPY